MGLEDQISGPADRLHDFVGRDATIVNRVVVDRDEYGDPIHDETTFEEAVEISARGSVSFERRVSGLDADLAAVIWLPADTDVYDGEEGADRSATQIHIGSDSYVVVDVTTEETGRHRCHCDKL